MEKFIGYATTATFAFPRLNNVTPYTAKDVVKGSADITFDAARVSGGTGYITGAVLKLESLATPPASFRLWLFNADPTVPADNAPFTLANAGAGKLVGVIDFSDPVSAAQQGGSLKDLHIYQSEARRFFKTADNSKKLYGVLTVEAAWTPEALQNITIDLHVDQN